MKTYTLSTVIVAIIGLAGCQNSHPSPPPPDKWSDSPRLRINDGIRGACSEQFKDDQSMLAAMYCAEADRRQGMSFEENIQRMTVACSPSDSPSTRCINCGMAMLRQVYGQ